MHLKQDFSDPKECTKMLKDTFTDILTNNGIFSDNLSIEELINKLA